MVSLDSLSCFALDESFIYAYTLYAAEGYSQLCLCALCVFEGNSCNLVPLNVVIEVLSKSNTLQYFVNFCTLAHSTLEMNDDGGNCAHK